MAFENFGKKLGAMASTASKKAGEQVQVAKLTLDKAGLEKDIEGIYIAMGRYCFTFLKDRENLPEELTSYCKEVESLKSQISQINNEIANCKDPLSVEFAETAPTVEVIEVLPQDISVVEQEK